MVLGTVLQQRGSPYSLSTLVKINIKTVDDTSMSNAKH
jgi:hypothetical protein